MSKQSDTPVQSGDRLKVVADCGIRNDDDSSVRSAELRGEHVTAAAVNCEYTHSETGERMVATHLSNGALAAIPRRALKPLRGNGTRTGYSRRFAEAFCSIFGT